MQRAVWVRSITGATALVAMMAAGACGGGSDDHGNGKPAAHASKDSPNATKSSSSPSASTSSGTGASGLDKHLLQQPDVGSSTQIHKITPAALAQIAQQIAGAASPTKSRSDKPACTQAINSGLATKSIDTSQLAGEVAGDGNSSLTEVLGPKKTFSRGISFAARELKKCVGATITENLNGTKVTHKPTFRTNASGATIITTTLTVPGKPSVHETTALATAGNYGFQLTAQSKEAIPADTFDKYLNKASQRASE